MAGTYSFLTADLLTNAILAELPLDGCTFERKLNGAGQLMAQLPLGDAALAKIDPIGSTQPGRTALYVDRDGVLVWGGIIWTRNWDSQQKIMNISGAEFWSYFQRRSIRSTLDYENVDQITIFQNYINYAQAQAGGNIGVVVPSVPASGVLRQSIDYFYQRSNLGTVCEGIAALDQGLDFTIEVSYSGTPSVPTKTLMLSYPRRGVIGSASGLVAELPSNIVGYQWPEDSTKSANTIDAIGAGNADQTALGSAQGTAALQAGYPLLEDTISLKSDTEIATLNARATSEVNARQFPVTVPTVVIRADMDPIIGSYTVGDEIRVKITDERFPATATGAPGLDAYYRIVGYTIQPPGSNNPEQVTLTLGAPVA